MTSVRINNALLSVSDKSGLLKIAEGLAAWDVHLMSTGGTRQYLMDNGLDVQDVADYTGSPEMMDGRVKTLHPKIHGGLLGRRGQDDEVMRSRDVSPIDLLIVNLYPFEKIVTDPESTLSDAIENIDIGGPAMLRSAAKNMESVAVIVDVDDYEPVLDELNANGGALSKETRFQLGVKAFEHVARYDAAIANYLGSITENGRTRFPSTYTMHLQKLGEMRYGENPHQQAAFYQEPSANKEPSAGKEPSTGNNVANAKQLQGKALSFNNVVDTDAALNCVKAFSAPACVIVKHANPCGAAESDDVHQAYQKAFETDPTSAFGGILAFNREVDSALAADIVERQFVEVVIAPGYVEEALTVFATKKNVRLLVCGNFKQDREDNLDFKRVGGGVLLQTRDMSLFEEEDLQVVSKRAPTEAEMSDLLFAWKVAKHVKSNAIVYARDCRTIGVGAGQMSRVYSARIAAIKADDEGLQVAGSVMASDAFFPFRDSIDTAAGAGITAVIQPGGSIRDDEVIKAADEKGMAMILTGMRHFRH